MKLRNRLGLGPLSSMEAIKIPEKAGRANQPTACGRVMTDLMNRLSVCCDAAYGFVITAICCYGSQLQLF
ncbi:hypothetical protein MCOR29_007701 [Pyricularia oryzae]|nr:hypothetical protein MCOR26_002167 [Pyricularia oryzae]KAI6313445.1 hypothetical protein MCOR29_007701 [Pyricularia oryzae]KAI6414717.1 hypothetical protein MCOR24_006247 [Pyricularia oryzae]KAI6487969.1 hypothetical protein MCOR13_009067 [Pyricularia oryzae]KAI6524880.1 hypothetical protein MCOR10_004796 [Pyricularia oryzae]